MGGCQWSGGLEGWCEPAVPRLSEGVEAVSAAHQPEPVGAGTGCWCCMDIVCHRQHVVSIARIWLRLEEDKERDGVIHNEKKSSIFFLKNLLLPPLIYNFFVSIERKII